MDENASPLRDLSADQLTDAVSEALSSWREAACPGGGHPALDVDEASIQSASVSFVRGGSNQNVVTFFDENWPYQANAVAKTHLTFDENSGELEDADIALDSDRFFLALDDQNGDVDVVAVLTHELGHFLGLGHSAVPGATMQAEAAGFGTTDLRSLEDDDIEAICTLYRPNAHDSNGASSGCSALRSDRPQSASGAFATLCLSTWFGLRRRRRFTTRSA